VGGVVNRLKKKHRKKSIRFTQGKGGRLSQARPKGKTNHEGQPGGQRKKPFTRVVKEVLRNFEKHKTRQEKSWTKKGKKRKKKGAWREKGPGG